MKNNSILTTPFSKMYNLKALVKDAAKWISTNASLLDASQDKYVSLISNVNPVVKTYISTCFNNIKKEELLDTCYYISTIMNKKIDVPELLTINEITVDGLQVDSIKNSEYKKPWINISSMLSPPSKSRYADLSISASNELMASVVRAMLCVSYNDSKEWLNPQSASFVVEFYTMTMRTVIDRLYRLNFEETGVVKYAFAYYYSSLLSDKKDKNGAPSLLHKSHTVLRGMENSLDELAVNMQEIVGKEDMAMVHVIEFIKTYGPARTSTLTVEMIYKALSIVSHNSVATWIAADYPPYLVFLLLLSMSGSKHPIISNVINNMFDKKYIRTNVEQLVKYTPAYTTVKR